MATRTTYLLMSGVSEDDRGRDHPLLSEYDFEHQKTYERTSDQHPAEKYILEEPLEEAGELLEKARTLSNERPEATVLVCEVEERFDQIDAVRTTVFMGGKQAGEIEHGHVFNVGGR